MITVMRLNPQIRWLLPLFLVLATASSVHAEPRNIEGVWLVEEKDAKVEIAPCGERLCGEIVWLRDPLDENGQPERDDENPDPALCDRTVLGLRILQDFNPRPNTRGLWTEGTIYDPNNGKTYKCQISFEDDDTLKIRGYIGFSLIGRTARWTRTEAR